MRAFMGILLLAALLLLPTSVTGQGASPQTPVPHSNTAVEVGNSWADPSSSVCAEKTPSMSYPWRPDEMRYNLACSRNAIGPLPPTGVRTGAPSTSGGTNPPGFAIYDQFMTYDSADGYVLLFGATGSTAPLNGTQAWAYHGGSWTLLSTTGMPEACVGSSLAYDEMDGYVVYLAGANSSTTGTCPNAGQTWTYSGGIWTRLHPGVSPAPRQAASFTNDSLDGYMLLFGGSCGYGGSLSLCNDTWSFRAGVWAELIANGARGAPTPRAGAGMAYDPPSGAVILFGGTGWWTPNFQWPVSLNDTWAFHAGVWTNLNIGGPPTIFNDGLVYDPPDHSLFYTAPQDNATYNGGRDALSEITWQFLGGKWVNATGYVWTNPGSDPGTRPASRLAEGLAFDYGDGYNLLFGGVANTWNALNDTWTSRNNVWTAVLTPSTAVSLVSNQTAVYVGEPFEVSVFPSGSWDLMDVSWSIPSACQIVPGAWGNTGPNQKFPTALDCQPSSTTTIAITFGMTDQFSEVGQAWLNVTPLSTFPVLSSITVSPTSAAVMVGGQVSFTADPTCAGGPCPSWVAYSWSLTNGLGTLSNTVGPTTAFQAGESAGTDGLWLNATENWTTLTATPVLITITSNSVPSVLSVALAPTSALVTTGGSAAFTADAACSPSPCPSSGLVFAWSLNNSLGSLNTTSGPAVDFSAGGSPGLTTLTVNGSIDGKGKSASASITLAVAVPTLSSVAVSPSSASIVTGGKATFTAAASCSGGPCPSGVSYVWALPALTSSPSGSLSPLTGPTSTYTAGTSTGSVQIEVVGTLNGVSKTANATVTVSAQPGKTTSSSGFLGLSGDTGYFLIGGAAAAVIVVLAVVMARRIRPKPISPKEDAEPAEAGAPGPTEDGISE